MTLRGDSISLKLLKKQKQFWQNELRIVHDILIDFPAQQQNSRDF